MLLVTLSSLKFLFLFTTLNSFFPISQDLSTSHTKWKNVLFFQERNNKNSSENESSFKIEISSSSKKEKKKTNKHRRFR